MYWRNQILFDVLISLALGIFLAHGHRLGVSIFDPVANETIIISARMWVAPTLTLLGMVCATTAFVFSAIERPEFANLKKSNAESQLWLVFSEAILWLSSSAIFAAVISLLPLEKITEILKFFALLILILVSISIVKFAWVMRQIISVRMAHSGGG